MEQQKKKQHFFPNTVRSLLYMYIRFVVVAFQLWRSSPSEKGPHWPIMALPWIHHCADLAQQSIQMCGCHEYSQMLVDNCYAFSFVAAAFHSEGEVLWRRGPLLTYYGHALDLPLGGFGPKVNTNERGLEYFIPTKFLVSIHQVIL